MFKIKVIGVFFVFVWDLLFWGCLWKFKLLEFEVENFFLVFCCFLWGEGGYFDLDLLFLVFLSFFVWGVVVIVLVVGGWGVVWVLVMFLDEDFWIVL